MLSTPQTITVDAVATDLHRVQDKDNSSIYRSADGNVQLTVSHQETKTRFRRMVRLDKTVVAADPLTAQNAYQKASVYIVIDEPLWGFSDAALLGYENSLKSWLTDSNVNAVLAGRH